MSDQNIIDNSEDFVFAVRALFDRFSFDEIIEGTSAKNLFGETVSAIEYRGLTVRNIPNRHIVEPHWNRSVVEKMYKMLRDAYFADKNDKDLRLIFHKRFMKDIGL